MWVLSNKHSPRLVIKVANTRNNPQIQAAKPEKEHKNIFAFWRDEDTRQWESYFKGIDSSSH